MEKTILRIKNKNPCDTNLIISGFEPRFLEDDYQIFFMYSTIPICDLYVPATRQERYSK